MPQRAIPITMYPARLQHILPRRWVLQDNESSRKASGTSDPQFPFMQILTDVAVDIKIRPAGTGGGYRTDRPCNFIQTFWGKPCLFFSVHGGRIWQMDFVLKERVTRRGIGLTLSRRGFAFLDLDLHCVKKTLLPNVTLMIS